MGSTIKPLHTRQSSRLRQLAIICVLLLAIYCFLLVPNHSLDSSRTILDSSYSYPSSPHIHQSPSLEVLNNLFLTHSQCTTTFPGLTSEIDTVVSKGPFTLSPSGPLGPLVARIHNGKLSILQWVRKSDLSADMLAHRSATLHQIAAALLTSPNPDEIPDTIFAFNHHDDPLSPSFSYSRPADTALNKPSSHIFPVPHFSFYSWPLPFIGSFPRAASAITSLESTFSSPKGSWSSKIPKAIWRGTTRFNNARAGRVRQTLLLTSSSKPWADIEALKWVTNGHNASNALAIEDFCRYKYIIQTEGITYSGRFQFHQLCASVVITPPLAWMQHTTHLVRPVFSSSGFDGGNPRLAPYPAPWVKEAWPREYRAEEANIVFVAPDWSDLEATIEWLEKHPQVAEGIARRQREMFHEAGYLSPAAEMCYWRAAIRGWSKVARYEGQGFEDVEGMPWEEFSLTEVHK
ncbi:uncharacterized protein BCR38DRAFT_334890 [Pseudomassariella vexata]|uniref:Glycosyl transferase CAP10 domain-containing protein n=1 Tax=Pseudomassariella vexata TaxID=1141098 RepID=A0A1Y2EB95_9PEZI|nr:uncharacterized protein BCR38DRAFT_334890 [Pseudomassariella vexata]ORY68838.1 hypothetical protein BCR38DRAFT_334890 [Pseudomassariella vexata]